MSLLSDPPVTEVHTAVPIVVAIGVRPAPDRPVRRRLLVLRVFLVALAVAVVVTVGGGLAARSLADAAAIHDATVRTDGIAVDLVQPVLADGVLTGDPAALRRLDGRVQEAVIGREIARVKVWTAGGSIVYSDEPRLIGTHFTIDDEEAGAFQSGRTAAEISDLDKPENRFERGDGQLLEVYRAVHTTNGTPLLFEVYYRYGDVIASADRIWMGFAVVIGASLLLLLLALLPLLNSLVRSVERAREQREMLLLKALDASDAERRRIAAAVHDGPVQDLVGASYRLSAAGAAVGGSEAGPAVTGAESAVRDAVDGLRDMLVDLYPAALSEAGLATALGDFVSGARSRGAVILLRVDDEVRLPADGERLLFRIARETIANAVKHGGSTPVRVRVERRGAVVELTVRDEGPGFDAVTTLRNPPAGHFGMRLLQDAVRGSGVDAELTVESAPGAGTTWRLRVA